MNGSNATQSAAKERAWRTFLQNIWVDVTVFVGPVIYNVIANSDGIGTKDYWIINGFSVAKTLALVIIAYVMRLKKAPSKEIAVNPSEDGTS